MIRKLLFRMARAPFMGRAVGTALQYCSRIIPVEKLHISREVIAFCHPQPSYESHIIISPRGYVRNLQTLSAPTFERIWQAALEIRTSNPEYSSFTVVANGGKRQDVQQVHFHMFTGYEVVGKCPNEAPGEILLRNDNICIFPHPDPDWEIHYVMLPAGGKDYFEAVLHGISLLDDRLGIVERGYSLVCCCDQDDTPACHIVAGSKLK